MRTTRHDSFCPVCGFTSESGWPCRSSNFSFNSPPWALTTSVCVVSSTGTRSGVSVTTLTGICSMTRSLRRLLASEGGTIFSVEWPLTLFVFGSDSPNATGAPKRRVLPQRGRGGALRMIGLAGRSLYMSLAYTRTSITRRNRAWGALVNGLFHPKLYWHDSSCPLRLAALPAAHSPAEQPTDWLIRASGFADGSSRRATPNRGC